jgi:uncharacterized NAD-dependent epimerase/dehydratase family protein
MLFEHQRDPSAILMAHRPAREREDFFAHREKTRTDPDREVVARAIVVAGEAVGNVLSWGRDQAGTREAGYWIARTHWGRGIAASALALVLAHTTARPVHANADQSPSRPSRSVNAVLAALGEDLKRGIRVRSREALKARAVTSPDVPVHHIRPPNRQSCTSMSAYRSGVKMPRAVCGSGARTNTAVPSQVAPSSDSSGP